MLHRRIDTSALLMASLVVMASIVVSMLVVDQRRIERHRAAATDFQKLVGGLGFGPDTNWETCAHRFDPRVTGDCIYSSGPLPGGAAFCPYDSVSLLLTLVHLHPAPSTADDHAASP